MPEPLKNRYNKAFVQDLSERLGRHTPQLDRSAFTHRILGRGWRSLELKARMSRISDTLAEHLGSDFEKNATVLTRVAQDYRSDGITGFEYMFLPEYIEKHGQDYFKLSMRALSAMTETGSAEFAIRPFIVADADKTLRQMQRWSEHKNQHVRRLASEGCRPRLPWAMALPDLKKDPTPILPILLHLKSDPAEYVRRSVANNLNDISKDHPELVLEMAQDWLGESADTDWVVKHACRGLLKAGNPEALALFGWQSPDNIQLKNFMLSPGSVNFGDAVNFEFTLSSKHPLGLLRLEYAIDFVKANGTSKRKVFKISESDRSEKSLTVTRQHKIVPISTRRYYSGTHHLAVIVNGVELGQRSFELVIP